MATSGLQHVAAMYAGVVAPPLIVGAAIGLSAADLTFLTGACLFTAGLATFLQTLGFWKIGARLPFVNGVTFAGVAPMTAIVVATEDKSDALPIIFGAVIVAGLLGFLAAPFFSKAIRIFPPVVTGSVITLIGVSLLPVAFGWAQGPDPRADDYGSTTYLTLAGITLLIVLLLRLLHPRLRQTDRRPARPDRGHARRDTVRRHRLRPRRRRGRGRLSPPRSTSARPVPAGRDPLPSAW